MKIKIKKSFFSTMDLLPNIENQKPEMETELGLFLQILVCL